MSEQIHFREKLEQSRNYGDLFELVKKSVTKTLRTTRVGLMLYLEDLPLRVGAYHQVGSNGIVLNRRIVDAMSKSTKSIVELNSFIYSLLLHEYLHSLGCLDERRVRNLVYDISSEIFGFDHPTVQMALELPMSRILNDIAPKSQEKGLELVRNFEKPRHQYIV